MQTLFWTVANTEGSLTPRPETPPLSADTNTEPYTDKLGFFSYGGGGSFRFNTMSKFELSISVLGSHLVKTTKAENSAVNIQIFNFTETIT
jgi:hypothetical protein